LIGDDLADDTIDQAELTELYKLNKGVSRSYYVAFSIASDAETDTLNDLDVAVQKYGEAATNGDEGEIK
jgi:hypothetical protein